MNELLNKALGLFIFCIVSPFIAVIWFASILFQGTPVLFWQKRAGKYIKPFWMVKFRTMRVDAESTKSSIMELNEADGPVFKIRNDPRFTKFGRFLSWSGLDELPQLINVVRGEMAIVGPRPLPLGEAKKIPNRYRKRFLVLPGITSTWVINGSHKLTFNQWMEMDCHYAESKNSYDDLRIILKSIILLVKLLFITIARFFAMIVSSLVKTCRN